MHGMTRAMGSGEAAVLGADELLRGRQEMVAVGRSLFECGFHAALAGNLSTRVASDRVLCTAHGADKGALTEDELLLCDLQGQVIEGRGHPTSELHMHLAAYRHRPDVRAVIHAHPPTATAFAAASRSLNELMLPEIVVWLGPVGLVPYATPGTPELAEQLEPRLAEGDAFLLENHGALTFGRDLRQASQRMELLEQNARVTLALHQLGEKPFRLSDDQTSALAELRRRLSGYGE